MSSKELNQLINREDISGLKAFLTKYPNMLNTRANKSKLLPAHLAVKNGSLSVVKLLIKLGAEWDIEDDIKTSLKIPLFYCVMTKHAEYKEIDKKRITILYYIAKHKPDILLAVDSDQFNVLHELVQYDNYKEIEKLLAILKEIRWPRLSEFINAGDMDHLTPLMVAAIHRNLYSAQILLKCKLLQINAQLTSNCNINSKKFKKYWTALHISCSLGDDVFVNTLINSGAKEIHDPSLGLKKPSEVINVHSKNNNRLESKILQILSKAKANNEQQATTTKSTSSSSGSTESSSGSSGSSDSSSSSNSAKSDTPTPEIVPSPPNSPPNDPMDTDEDSLHDTAAKKASFVKKKLQKSNLENDIFGQSITSNTVKAPQETYINDYSIQNTTPVGNSAVSKFVFSRLKLEFQKLRKMRKPVYAKELMDALLILLQSILGEPMSICINNVWLIESKIGAVKRLQKTLVILCPLSIYIKEHEPLYNAQQIALVCPLSTCYMLANWLEEPELLNFKNELLDLFKNFNFQSHYKLFEE